MFKRENLAACITAGMILGMSVLASAEEKEVRIEFNGDGCPEKVDPKAVDLKKRDNDKVKWVAVNADGSAYEGGFTIIFDPFNGGRRLSTNKDWLKSPPVDGSIPASDEVKYKYSIKGHECDDYLDPVIRVL